MNTRAHPSTGALVERRAAENIECPQCERYLSEWIVPPGRNKGPTESAYHRFAYARAGAALRRSTTWLIVGYSCPDYDKDVISLLHAALPERALADTTPSIYVIAPDADRIAAALSAQLGHSVVGTNETFTAFVDRSLGRLGVDRPGFA